MNPKISADIFLISQEARLCRLLTELPSHLPGSTVMSVINRITAHKENMGTQKPLYFACTLEMTSHRVTHLTTAK